ncbi:Predicted dithiol-disulfide isomerase, DsbA family [Roseomonas rosea]|uniref:Predicted dithiol-disulfide isomerase, DsbA family n=1 Tax=Muricoccus roseus TaxID=198092 RepID=A0A1M6BXL1_9PROT|nr:DsbA family oxidoreductase [Roseomonas rosea]SHI53512.1 Predicted dithiol-disulfide isomerase, DsbA family [Roseomonas rosea]
MSSLNPPVLLVVVDTVCPWCWVGKRRLDAALATLAEEGLQLSRQWHPFQLNPDMPSGGMLRAEYRARKFGSVERGRQLDARLAAEGAKDGLPFDFERIERSPNSLDSHRLIRLAMMEGGPEVTDRVAEGIFSAYFAEGRDIGDPAVLAAIGDAAGLPAGRSAAILTSEEGREEVARDAARAQGIGGVPAVILDRQMIISGAQPAEAMAAAIREGLRAAVQPSAP